MVTRAAFPHMKKQKYGRIIMTSSPSGLYGNFGQANYAAGERSISVAKIVSVIPSWGHYALCWFNKETSLGIHVLIPCAAKMGLVGFSNTVAKEGDKYNITCNAIAPSARSRMTADLMPPVMEQLLKVEDLAPIVVYLCHESCNENGIIIESAGGWAGKVRLQKSEGVVLQRPFTLEDVRDSWSKICDMSRPLYHTSNQGLS